MTTNDAIISRFETLGRATVELHTKRFTTTFSHRGAPYAADTPYEVDGWNWRCLGCAAYGREGDTYHDPGFRDLRQARADANGHAGDCRSKPATAPGWEYATEWFRAKWETLDDILDRRGPDGWELVTVDWDAHRAVFKRPAIGGAR